MTSIYLLEIGEHATCYTGVNQAHAVVTSKGNTKIAAIITILTDMSEMYGVNQTTQASSNSSTPPSTTAKICSSKILLLLWLLLRKKNKHTKAISETITSKTSRHWLNVTF